jgi:hypothetical protein
VRTFWLEYWFWLGIQIPIIGLPFINEYAKKIIVSHRFGTPKKVRDARLTVLPLLFACFGLQSKIPRASNKTQFLCLQLEFQ